MPLWHALHKKFTYYAGIMLDAFTILLCWHNWLRPSPGAIIYGAPEASVASKHSPKMDVYSFGVLVLETLTSTLPIENLYN